MEEEEEEMGEMANVGARGGWLVGGARLVGDEREMDVVFEARLGGGREGLLRIQLRRERDG